MTVRHVRIRPPYFPLILPGNEMKGTELSRNSREPSRTNWNERSNRRPKREGEGGGTDVSKIYGGGYD